MKKPSFAQKTVFLWLFLAVHQLMGASQAPAKSNSSDIVIEVKEAHPPKPDAIVVIDVPHIGGFMDGDDEVAAITTPASHPDTSKKDEEPKTAPVKDDKADEAGKKGVNDHPHSRTVHPRMRPSKYQKEAEAKAAKSKDAIVIPTTNRTQAITVINPEEANLRLSTVVFNETTFGFNSFTPSFKRAFMLDGQEFASVEPFFEPKRFKWDGVVVARLRRAIREQILQNRDLLDLLLASGESLLMYSSDNTFWGMKFDENDEHGEGQNILGKILMVTRSDIRDSIERGYAIARATTIRRAIALENAKEIIDLAINRALESAQLYKRCKS